MADASSGLERAEPRQRAAPRFSRLKPEERRRGILEAARRCLAEGGVNGFTVAEIASAAGISNGLIGHYFATKDDLLVATYELEAERLKSATRATVHADLTGADSRIAGLIDSAFSPEIFTAETVAVWLSLWDQVRTNRPLREAHKEAYATYRRAFARGIAAAAEERGLTVDAALLARDLTALIDGLWLEWGLEPELFSPVEAKDACRRLLAAHGIRLKTQD